MPPFLKRNQKKRGLNHVGKASTVPRMCRSVSNGSSGSESSSKALIDCEVIGPVGLKELPSCPCCNRNLNTSRQTVGDTRLKALYSSLFMNDGSETESCHSCDDMDEEGSIMFGVLSGGTQYSVTKNLVQGWVHKKGTGNDWIGSRGWKPRWAVLSLARIAGQEVDVPLLQIFWFPTSATPSTVIHLDSAVVLPQERTEKSDWNCHRFHIQHVRKSIDESSIQVTRTFCCPREGRDAWCQAISKSLLDYEKEKALVRQQSRSDSLSPPRWRSFIGWATGDAHPSAAKMTPPVNKKAPSSPGSPPRDLPRHEPALIGESFLAQIMDL